MDDKLENNDWINEAPYLARLPKTNPLSVPDGYFEGLNENISNAIYFDSLKHDVGHIDMSVPAGYFEQFQERINNRITVEELKSKVSADGFIVPEGYFDTLQGRILNQISPVQKKTKLFKLWHSNVMKYSTAACIVIISALGIYFNQQSTGKQSAGTEQVARAATEDQALFDIDEQVIIDQIETENSAQTANTTATETEMENYILSNYSQSDIAANM